MPDGTVAWREINLPALEPHHVRVKNAFSYIIAGTELRSPRTTALAMLLKY